MRKNRNITWGGGGPVFFYVDLCLPSPLPPSLYSPLLSSPSFPSPSPPHILITWLAILNRINTSMEFFILFRLCPMEFFVDGTVELMSWIIIMKFIDAWWDRIKAMSCKSIAAWFVASFRKKRKTRKKVDWDCTPFFVAFFFSPSSYFVLLFFSLLPGKWRNHHR